MSVNYEINIPTSLIHTIFDNCTDATILSMMSDKGLGWMWNKLSCSNIYETEKYTITEVRIMRAYLDSTASGETSEDFSKKVMEILNISDKESVVAYEEFPGNVVVRVVDTGSDMLNVEVLLGAVHIHTIKISKYVDECVSNYQIIKHRSGQAASDEIYIAFSLVIDVLPNGSCCSREFAIKVFPSNNKVFVTSMSDWCYGATKPYLKFARNVDGFVHTYAYVIEKGD